MKLPEPTPTALNVELPDGPIASVARALPAGASLDEFEVGEIIGEGSTAIVYAATDRARAIPVAIAEYMPARLAQRHHEAQVTPRTSAQADAFAKGLKAFINETRTLAQCRHASLVRIVRLWEANGTAYRVMPRYPARRLLEVRQSMNEPPDEQAVRALLDALLGALGAFPHAEGGHGKVTPSNILLLADSRPSCWAHSAAEPGDRRRPDRRADDQRLNPASAPIEQMVEIGRHSARPLSRPLHALAGVVTGSAGSCRRQLRRTTPHGAKNSRTQCNSPAAPDLAAAALQRNPLLDAHWRRCRSIPPSGLMRQHRCCARLDTAPAAAGGRVIAASLPPR